MKLREFLAVSNVILDGGTGTILQAAGLQPGELPERWNISHPDEIVKLHRNYYDAGSNVVCTNTFGANLLKFDENELEEIIKAAVANANKARETSSRAGEKFVALDIGPSGKLLKPYGDLDFEDAVSLFAHTVRLGAKYGCDLVMIETMNDLSETKAALLAVKENCDLPVFVSNAYGSDGKLMTGASPEAMVAMLEGMGADAVGLNCSFGPDALLPVAERLLACASVPVIFKPNAGIPKSVNGKTVFDVSAADFGKTVAKAVRSGVRVAGGCCGTTPEYIRALTDDLAGAEPVPLTEKNLTVVSSYAKAVTFGKKPVLIGERINPTGKKRFKEALKAGDTDYILKEGIRQQEAGVDILDVNVGLPEIDEKAVLTHIISELQAVTDLPLQIDTTDPAAMESALRRYAGKAMINSVNGKEESMNAFFPLVKKYGGLVVALTLDENGIPETAEGRIAVAGKILKKAAEYGIKSKDIIFDPLAMTVSADIHSPTVTLEAVRGITAKLGCLTSLGVSNVSFGLPERDTVNSVFFAEALRSGLSAAILNPYSDPMMRTFVTHCALAGLDESCAEYIEYVTTFVQTPTSVRIPGTPTAAGTDVVPEDTLVRAIAQGRREQSADITRLLLSKTAPLDIINGEIIPALDNVGRGFEEKKVYLPQLLMSAEAAKASFEVIKSNVSTENAGKGATVILATVKGDIHDIGKNIVRLLLENYGFNVIDLGKDVPPETVVEETVRTHAPVVGLSALMTTTVPAMEETIRLLKKEAPWCRTVVGGAVLTQEYADAIGADKYAKDAMETVRYAESITKAE